MGAVWSFFNMKAYTVLDFCGFETGENIFTGEKLKSEPDKNPVKISYSIYPYCMNGLRNSWDPITVYCAVNQDNPLYIKSANYHIAFNNAGKLLLNKIVK